MSRSELERFAGEAGKAPSLLDRYGGSATPAELAARLRQDGYAVTDAEVEEASRNAAQPDGGVPDGSVPESGVFVVSVGTGLRLALPKPPPLAGRAGLDAIFAHMRKRM